MLDKQILSLVNRK